MYSGYCIDSTVYRCVQWHTRLAGILWFCQLLTVTKCIAKMYGIRYSWLGRSDILV